MEILNTAETSKKIIEIIENAKEEVLIISPYLDIKDKYKKAIENNKIANIVFIYGKSKLKNNIEEYLNNQENISILLVKDLHAKVYLNENECIISSMNLYKFSEENNFEISSYTKEKKIIEEIYNRIEIELVNTKKIFRQKLSKKLKEQTLL